MKPAAHIQKFEKQTSVIFRLLYLVWNEKTDLLKRVVELNPFSSEHFYWIDMGSLRPAANTDKIHMIVDHS